MKKLLSRLTRASWSVRTRILTTILTVAGLGMLVAGTTAYFVQREQVLANIDSHLLTTSENAEKVVDGLSTTVLKEALSAVVKDINTGNNEGTLGIIDGSAALVPAGVLDVDLSSDGAFVDRVVSEVDEQNVVMGTADTSIGWLRYLAMPITVEGDAGKGIFVAAFDIGSELDEITASFRAHLLTSAVSLVLTGLIGWFVSGRLLRPIRDLRQTASRISVSDLSERIPVRGRDDVSELTSTVNNMLDRIQDAVMSQKKLLDDVGHELKTPITIVRGHLELMELDNPADVLETRALVIDELDRMSGLVKDISQLASLQRPNVLSLSPVHVSEFTKKVLLKASAMSGPRWVNTQTAEVSAVLDPERITQALLQLASNAVRHGKPGGVVEINSSLVSVDGQRMVAFTVSDDGPGIPAGEEEHIFNRFRRGTSEGRGEQGSGLGLTIVKAIAEVHNGTVTVTSTPGQGATFTLTIPILSGIGIAPERNPADHESIQRPEGVT